MKWFLFIVVLNLLHKYAYGKEITMFVNVNDTVDIRVEKETKLGFLYSCKASQYSDNGILISTYTLMELKNCQLNQKDQSVMKYFEFLDYDASCSFTISPFPKEFYGHWIVNTTSDIGEHEEAMYSYKYQEFYLTIPPKENISYSTDDYFEYTNDTEKNITHEISCFNNNPITLRPKKVFGQIIKCLAIHYHDFLKPENATEAYSYYPNKTVYEIYPNIFHEFVFTGNNKSCQFKIKQMRDQYFDTGKYELIHPLHERWEIRTYYESSKELFHQVDTFNIRMINRKHPLLKIPRTRVLPIIRGPAYIKMERLDAETNSTISKFTCQFDARDGQTEKIKLPEYNHSIIPQDNFYRRINYENDYGYFFNAKYSGYYDCILKRKNETYKMYNFKTLIVSFQYPKKLFDGPFKAAARRSCHDILAIEGSMFPFWLTNIVPKNISQEKLGVVIEMPNGTLIETHYTKKSSVSTGLRVNSFGHDDILEQKGLYKNVSIIDNGTWKLYYHNVSSKDPVYPELTVFYFVTTWDSTHVKVVVDMTTKNSSMSVYTIKKNPKKCLRLSTNGTVIDEFKPKIHRVKRNTICLNQNYEINDNLNECEFEINQSSENNYVMNEFSIDYGNFTINRTIILQNNFQAIKKYNKITDMDGKKREFVKHGDDFLVNCSHNRPLLFCRIQDSTQQVTHITDKSTLEAGNCSMLVTNSNILDHNGTWKCQLASDESNIGSTIIEYFFSVEVRNFYVRSHIEYINKTIQQKNETTIKQVVLHCEISNYLKRFKNDLIGGHQIDYCLWSHPNGSIISKNSNKYTVNTATSFSCDLTIHSLYEEDFGNWSCSPHLKLLTDLNLNNTIHLIEDPKMFISKKKNEIN